jgi:hypothetical protein
VWESNWLGYGVQMSRGKQQNEKMHGVLVKLGCFQPFSFFFKALMSKIFRYTEPSFVQECTELYLKERSEFRRTGIMKPKAERRGTKAYREARKAAELTSEAASSSSVGGSVKA